MPRYALLRQDRALIPAANQGEIPSVKVTFHPIRSPQGIAYTIEAASGEDALRDFRETFGHLNELLLAVEPYSEQKHGNAKPRIH
jgi:hypothetical protein